MYFVIPAYILDFLHVPAWQTAKFTLWNTFDMYKPNDVIFYQHLASDESVVDFMSLDGCPDYENIIPDILFLAQRNAEDVISSRPLYVNNRRRRKETQINR